MRPARSARTLAFLAAALACSDTSAANFSLQCDLFSNFVFDGGPGRDGIPALTNPELATAPQALFLGPEDRVLGVANGGAARAYPFIVMWWHEIVNDTLGGAPLLVTYCPLTGSGLAFDSRVGGEVRNFGVSGLLFENNLMMFDRATESLWPQLLLSARCGRESGTELARVPVVETTWAEWQARHPTTTVVTVNTGFDRNYGQYPYGTYDLPTNRTILFPGTPFSSALMPKQLVLGVQEGRATVAYSFEGLRNRGAAAAVNDTIAGRPILITFRSAANTAIAFDRLVAGQTLTFRVSAPDPTLLEDTETGSRWNLWGQAVAGPLAGRALAPLADAYTLFWFSWSVFHPNTRLVE